MNEICILFLKFLAVHFFYTSEDQPSTHKGAVSLLEVASFFLPNVTLQSTDLLSNIRYTRYTHANKTRLSAFPFHVFIGSDFTFIDISPRPSANDPLTGGDTLGARCSELSNQPNIVLCLPRSLLPPLIDGDLGPEGANYTNTMVHAWHRSTGTVYITYTLDTSTEIRHMDLYFYSITSMGIGLPSVTVYRGSTVVGYHIFGNDDITQEDNMRRQILLSLRSTSSSRSYTLQFDFDNTDVDWLVLSETRLCTVPIQGIYHVSR